MSKKKQQQAEQQPEQQPVEKSPVEIASETMLGDLMHVVVDSVKSMPRTWQEMSEQQQDDYLAMIDKQCRAAIEQCVQIIASQGMVRMPVEIVQTTIKDGVKVQVELVRAEQVVEMVEARTKYAMLVMANVNDFVGEEGKPKADKDQQDLLDGGEMGDIAA